MKIEITIDDLADKRACEEAIEWFSEEFGETLECEWTKQKQVELIRDTDAHKYFRWAVQRALVSEWTMKDSNFEDADLRRADLRRADQIEGAYTDDYTKLPNDIEEALNE